MPNNVLCFIREIENLEENISSNIKLAKRFIEIDNDGKVDESTKILLNELKYKKIPSKLPKENIFEFKVRKNYPFHSRPNLIKKLKLWVLSTM